MSTPSEIIKNKVEKYNTVGNATSPKNFPKKKRKER
jgi:hypothetical protein